MQPHKSNTVDQFLATSAPYILVIDDEPDIRTLLQEILEDEGYEVEVAEDGQHARTAYHSRKPDLVLLDIWMPDVDGISLLKEWIAEGELSMPVIMMSGHGTVETAVEATRLGAFDFIEKPLSLAKLLVTVEQALETEKKQPEPSAHKQHGYLVTEPVGRSPIMQRLREQIKRIAEHDSWVLLTGETGSGTQVAAHFLHANSLQHDKPFVEINLAALSEELTAARLFGLESKNENSVGLFEQINGGTLFLRNIDEAGPETQNMLLDALQNRQFQKVGGTAQIPFQARVICSTHQQLERLVEQHAFRKDLFYLINVVPLTIPPLREHREDIPDLLNFYANIFIDQEKLPYRRFSLAGQNRLRNYEWYGNIRELINIVQRLLVTSSGTEISLEEVEAALNESETVKPASQGMAIAYDLPLREAREQFEKDYLVYQLKRTGGSVGKVAKLIGMERTHLYRKLRSLDIDPKQILLEDN